MVNGIAGVDMQLPNYISDYRNINMAALIMKFMKLMKVSFKR